MLAKEQLEQINQILRSTNDRERLWLSGYAAGFAEALSGSATQSLPSATVVQQNIELPKITLLYATETGNAKKLANDLSAHFKSKKVSVKVTAVDQYRLTDLAKEKYLLVVTSTQGDGDAPASAQKFYDYIHKENIDLSKLTFAVLGLGDTAYPKFCQTAIDIDAQFKKLQAQALLPAKLCDTDYQEEALAWADTVVDTLTAKLGGGTNVSTQAVSGVAKAAKKNYEGEVLSIVNLNDDGSNKETYHIEISADELVYEPGDALGLLPLNAEDEVKQILNRTGIDGNQTTKYGEEEISFKDLLTKKINITALSEKSVQEYGKAAQKDIKLVKPSLKELVAQYPLQLIAQYAELLPKLDRNAPRLYSISSSPVAHEGEVHLTVAKNVYTKNGEKREGIASSYLSNLKNGDKLDFYIHKNAKYRLPSDDKDIILVGPGTGIAPFRSFLAQREALGAEGKNWLFFGEQHFVSDFLYQTEIQNWLASGLLTHLDVAFSRDQKEKIYVQHRIEQKGKELVDWLEKGAYIYVCGAKTPMSEDVEKTIVAQLSKHKNIDENAAKAYLEQLELEGRYLKDVY